MWKTADLRRFFSEFCKPAHSWKVEWKEKCLRKRNTSNSDNHNFEKPVPECKQLQGVDCTWSFTSIDISRTWTIPVLFIVLGHSWTRGFLHILLLLSLWRLLPTTAYPNPSQLSYTYPNPSLNPIWTSTLKPCLQQLKLWGPTQMPSFLKNVFTMLLECRFFFLLEIKR